MDRTTEVFERLPQIIDSLRAAFLPDVPREREPTELEYLQTRAFLVLSHSALEEAIEHELKSAVEKSLIQSARLPHVSIALSLRYSADVMAIHNSRLPDSTTSSIRSLSGLYYSKCIKNNNGIRRRSIEKLVKPLGIDLNLLGDQVDEWLGYLERVSLGS